jgi:hypothetical protein
MSYQSDAGLIITDVDLYDFEIDPDLTLDHFSKGEDSWQYKVDFYKESGLETDEDHDTVRVEIAVTFTTLKKKKTIKINVQTEYYIKIMERHEIAEELWEYMVNTAVWHCAALFLYKTEGNVPVTLKMPEIVALQHNLIRTQFLELWNKN